MLTKAKNISNNDEAVNQNNYCYNDPQEREQEQEQHEQQEHAEQEEQEELK